jgi:signal transduction histidine kinase/CheY-like chemotaxis protein
MPASFLQKKLRGITISQKLYFTVGVMVLLVTFELCVLWFAVGTLSSVRSFVNGEGLWSKAQKDAVSSLLLYAHSHNEKDYRAFHEFLKVPLGDNKTRLELLKKKPDMRIAREGFIEGRNHREDVDGMIKLFLRFGNVSFLKKAIVIWSEAENNMEELIANGDKLHNMIGSNTATQQEIDNILVHIDFLNRKLTNVEDDFSFTLGEGTRWLEHIVLQILLALSLTIGTIGISITISVSRGIEKGVKEIINGASLVSKGLLNTRVKVYSRDEIGLLAISFNQMTDTLEHSLKHIRELKDIEAKLKKQKEKAEASEKTKQLFLAKMSHEIRTPMNAILGFAKLLEESLTTKEQQEYIRIIIKSGDNLLVILNDILDFSRMEAGKIVFENAVFSPADIVHTAKLMMKPKATQKEVSLVCTVDKRLPKKIMGDSVRLNQILLNLVSNAIKFTNKGEIKIYANFVEERDDSFLLEFGVVDTGIGIALDQQEKVFESFEQAANTDSHRFGGIGLGLSIVKQLIELQKGELFVDSKIGRGSDFHFRLSFLKYKDAINDVVSEKIETGIADNRGIRILVVEDNVINQMLVIKVLKKKGFETELAENGLLALEKYEKKDFDIILMDLQMPEMDGYEATQKIRALNSYKKDIPIIALSAHTFKGEYERCMEIGINDFISKPFDSKDLFDKIFKLLKKGTLEENIV